MKLKVGLLNPGLNQFAYTDKRDEWIRAAMLGLEKKGYPLPSLKMDLEVTKLEPDYILRGKLDFKVSLTCDRCAEPFETGVEHQFDLAFLQTAGKKEEIDAVELDQTAFEGDEIDLAPVLEEQFFLSLPFQALCRETCKGICQHCGKSLNLGPCHCSDKVVDSPFGVLEKLKQ